MSRLVNMLALVKHVRSRVPDLMASAMWPYRGDPGQSDFEFIAKRLAHRYAQAEFLYHDGLIGERTFALERYKLTAEDEALARERFQTRAAWEPKMKSSLVAGMPARETTT